MRSSQRQRVDSGHRVPQVHHTCPLQLCTLQREQMMDHMHVTLLQNHHFFLMLVPNGRIIQVNTMIPQYRYAGTSTGRTMKEFTPVLGCRITCSRKQTSGPCACDTAAKLELLLMLVKRMFTLVLGCRSTCSRIPPGCRTQGGCTTATSQPATQRASLWFQGPF